MESSVRTLLRPYLSLLIAVPAKDCNVEELATMVSGINSESVDIKERLSNQVYFYDSRERKLSVATDTSNKRLDTDGTSQHEIDKDDRGVR